MEGATSKDRKWSRGLILVSDHHMIRTMTPENMCHMTPTPPLPSHGHYPNMHRDMYLKPEPIITQYPIGPATSGSGDMQQTQMLPQLLQHPQGQEWVVQTCDMEQTCCLGWLVYTGLHRLVYTVFDCMFSFPPLEASPSTRRRRGSTLTLQTAP